MISMHSIKTEQFEGPLDVLLQLIESAKLDITAISLSRITEEYLSILTKLSESLSADELAEFLVVASKLLLIKSRALIAAHSEEDEEEMREFEERLRLYRLFVNAGREMARQWNTGRTLFVRRAGLDSVTAVFSPPPKLSADSLYHTFASIASRAIRTAELIRSACVRYDARITVAEKIEHIRSLIASRVSVVFKSLLAQKSNKSDVIVSFLALLELIKQRSVRAAQDELFAEIKIHSY